MLKLIFDHLNSDKKNNSGAYTVCFQQEIQLSRPILSHKKYKLCGYTCRSNQFDVLSGQYRLEQYALTKTTKYLKDQTILLHFLVEDKKLEQLEAEVENLTQSIIKKDRIIDDLNGKAQQIPTLTGDSLDGILDLFLKANKQIIESENRNSNSFAQGKLEGH
ncbi:16260_t:CDS:2 [Dentiscutata heterogama]|uniref:16260_t:CDS:1 n=1 Tax=Dentiscutata heterogama TaxID=1316150 RepID=A0ACA9LKG4_9GLOM|nr:16260_t:CDS:2 [Dentiscutata heterogama]